MGWNWEIGSEDTGNVMKEHSIDFLEEIVTVNVPVPIRIPIPFPVSSIYSFPVYS